MRRILIERARRKLSATHGANAERIEIAAPINSSPCMKRSMGSPHITRAKPNS